MRASRAHPARSPPSYADARRRSLPARLLALRLALRPAPDYRPRRPARANVACASALRREQRLDSRDHVANRAHRLELLRLDPAARHLLQLDREIDGVDAVQIELFEQVRFGRHAFWLDGEVLFEDGADALKNLGVGHGHSPFFVVSPDSCASSRWLATSAASVLIERKCSRVRSSFAAIVNW